MNVNKCSRCGSFYVLQGNVCPKCEKKDNAEFNSFKSYIKENGFENSLQTISGEIGVSVKNLDRFTEYKEFENFQETLKKADTIISL